MSSESLTRRDFIVQAFAVATGVAVSVRPARAAASSVTTHVEIDPDGRVVIVSPAAEIGQGTLSTLPKIVCDELGADWDAVEVRLPVADAIYANPAKGRQSTGGSDAVRGYFEPLRVAGAALREMLVAAAAARWDVSETECDAAGGQVQHAPTGRAIGFGELAAEAARRPVPAAPRLRSRVEWTLIGRATPRKDTPAKTDGSALFTADLSLPGLLTATIRQCPVFGGRVREFDAATVRTVPGVVEALVVADDAGTEGVAVVAKEFWSARRALDALSVEWDVDGRPQWDSNALRERLLMAVQGDTRAAPAGAGHALDVIYEVPYLAHACMEPPCATAWVTRDTCRVWAPSQQQGAARALAARLTGLPLSRVQLQTMPAGGGFGRKWELDFIHQVVLIAKALEGRPVRLVWTRELDLQSDRYRPGYAMRAEATFDTAGLPGALRARIAGQSIFTSQRRALPGPDPTAIGGLVNDVYDLPAIRIDYAEVVAPIPVGFWRGVSLSQNGFFGECLVDELAARAGEDPWRFRQHLLCRRHRERAVLDAVAAMAGWGRHLPRGCGLGIAFTKGYGSITAQVAEVAVVDGALRVHDIWCAHDCGLAVDPDIVAAQLEGGIAYGLCAAMYGEVEFLDGAVAQSNFGDYRVLRLPEMPRVTIRLVDSGGPIGGAGESGVPGVAPAIANALYAATGRRVRRLPLRSAGIAVP